MVEKEAGSYLERLDAYEEQERSRLEECWYGSSRNGSADAQKEK